MTKINQITIINNKIKNKKNQVKKYQLYAYL